MHPIASAYFNLLVHTHQALKKITKSPKKKSKNITKGKGEEGSIGDALPPPLPPKKFKKYYKREGGGGVNW